MYLILSNKARYFKTTPNADGLVNITLNCLATILIPVFSTVDAITRMIMSNVHPTSKTNTLYLHTYTPCCSFVQTKIFMHPSGGHVENFGTNTDSVNTSPFRIKQQKGWFQARFLEHSVTVTGLEGWLLQTEQERWSKALLPFILFCVVGGDYD